jgi:serine/threonine protein kinase
MNISKRTHIYDTSFLEENIKFRDEKFLEYKVEEKLFKNRGTADTYLLSKGERYFVLTLYKRGFYAPRESLTKLQDMSEDEKKYIAPIVTCGYSDDFGRDYTISEIRKKSSLKNKNLKNYKNLVEQVVEAIEVSHDNNIFHYDLRPEDIFIEDKQPSTYKIYGFGHISLDEAENSQNNLRIKGLISKYQAPELEKCNGCEKSDLWSLGVILHEKIYGKCPFEYEKNEFGKYKINFSNLNLSKSNGLEYNELLKGLLEVEPDKRWGTKEVKEWLVYIGNEEKSIKKNKEDNKFFYKNKYYSSLKELNKDYAYTPQGYLELKKLYYKADIFEWLIDKKEVDKISELNYHLSSKYLFNKYLYNYGDNFQKLYFKGYNLKNIENLDRFSQVDYQKLAKLMKSLSSKTSTFFCKIHGRFLNKVSKYFFYYSYVDNSEFYFLNKKASEYDEIPDYKDEEDSVLNYLIFREEKNYKNIYTFIYNILTDKDASIEKLKDSLILGSFQLALFKSSLIDETEVYLKFVQNKLKKSKNKELDVFKRILYDYNFLKLPFENVLVGRSQIEFYDFYVKEKYGNSYFRYYKKITSLFSKKSILRLFSYKTLEEIYVFYPKLRKISLREKEYIKYQIEILSKIYEYNMEDIEEIDYKTTKIKFIKKIKNRLK